MKTRMLLASALLGTFVLAACVDTTGLSAATSRGPHPKTNPDAIVTVEEFADLQCPACRGAKPLVNAIMEKYGRQIRFDFKHFPIRSIHQYAIVAAEAAECAADQGKFWEFEELAYEKQPELNKNAPAAWAKILGLDMDLFERCTSSNIKKKMILAEYDEGRNRGVQGTPTFFVNGKKVQSTMDALSAAIDEASQGAMQRL